MTEPESALSPQRQLELLALSLLENSGQGIHRVRLQDPGHCQITRSILDKPERNWRHLRGET